MIKAYIRIDTSWKGNFVTTSKSVNHRRNGVAMQKKLKMHAVSKKEFEYLRKYEAEFKNSLARESGPHHQMFIV
jgi:hypothetical protein